MSLGVGVLDSEDAVLILTSGTMMKATLDMDKIAAFSPRYIYCLLLYSPDTRFLNRRTGRTNLIKSILMQGIMYGSSDEAKFTRS